MNNRVLVCLVPLLVLCGCRYAPRQPISPQHASGCVDRTPVGPPTHIELVRTEEYDSVLAAQGLGHVVAAFRWSSDSMAALSAPHVETPRLEGDTPPADTLASAVSPQRGLTLFAGAPGAGRYRLTARVVAAAPVSGLLQVEPGRSDTIKVYVQMAGGRLCY